MSYITFGILTNSPATVRDFLIARGILKDEEDYPGARPGLEWREVPHKIVVTPAVGVEGEEGYVPPIYDTKRLFIMKFAHDMKADEQDGEEENDEQGVRRSIFLRTKIGKWVQANSSAYSYTEPNGGRTFTGRKVTGQQTWLIDEDSTALIHGWQ